MSHPVDPLALPGESLRRAELRHRAAARLAGAAARKGSAAGAADALVVLHAMASSPATAADALALLHELQVHQVELDLQAQELRESRAELEATSSRATQRYDRQPVGCLTVDAALLVQELNLSAARLLGVVRDDALGLPLQVLLGAECARRLHAALAGIDTGLERSVCPLVLRPGSAQERRVVAHVGPDVAGQRYLVNLVADAEEPAPGSAAA